MHVSFIILSIANFEVIAMRQLAVWLLILGVGSFILPMMGLQFKLLSLFGEATPFVGGGMAVLGGILLGVSFVTEKNENNQAE